MLLATLILACAPQETQASAPAARIVPQFGLGELVAEWRGRPMLRVDGVLAHVLQVHALDGPGLAHQVEFAAPIQGTAWRASDLSAWVATGTGLHRVDARTGSVEVVRDDWTGKIALHPEKPWLGLLGFPTEAPQTRRYDRHHGSLRVLDLASGAWLAETPIPTYRSSSLAWVGDLLHGTGSGGRGFLTRSGRGEIRWVHLTLDPAEGGATTVEERSFGSAFDVRQAEGGEGFWSYDAPVEDVIAWKHPRGTGPGQSTSTVLVAQADALDQATGGSYDGSGQHVRLRLNASGTIELLHLPWEQAPNWTGAAQVRDSASLITGFQERIEDGLCEIHDSTPRRPGFALLHDWGEGSLARHRWDPNLGVLAEVWSTLLPHAAWSHASTVVSPDEARCVVRPSDFPERPILILDLESGSERGRVPWPQDLEPQNNDSTPTVQWSLDGRRLLVVTWAQVSVYDLDEERWISHRPREHYEGHAFPVPGGWLIASSIDTRRLDHEGGVVEGHALPRILDLRPDPGFRRAIGTTQDGRAVLLDLERGVIERRWVESAWNPHGESGWVHPSSLWSPNGRYLIRAVGQSGRVRAVDPSTGEPFLEWQVLILENGRSAWLAWTPEGAWDGTRDAFSELAYANEDGKTWIPGSNHAVSPPTFEGRDPQAISRRVAALFEPVAD